MLKKLLLSLALVSVLAFAGCSQAADGDDAMMDDGDHSGDAMMDDGGSAPDVPVEDGSAQ
jgi:hypothetical protein